LLVVYSISVNILFIKQFQTLIKKNSYLVSELEFC